MFSKLSSKKRKGLVVALVELEVFPGGGGGGGGGAERSRAGT